MVLGNNLKLLQNCMFGDFLRLCALCSAFSVWTWSMRLEDCKSREIVMMCCGFSGIPIPQAEVKNVSY